MVIHECFFIWVVSCLSSTSHWTGILPAPKRLAAWAFAQPALGRLRFGGAGCDSSKQCVSEALGGSGLPGICNLSENAKIIQYITIIYIYNHRRMDSQDIELPVLVDFGEYPQPSWSI